MLKYLQACLGALLLVFVFLMVLTIPVWAMYNAILPGIFGLPRLEPDQVFYLLVFIKLVTFPPVPSKESK